MASPTREPIQNLQLHEAALLAYPGEAAAVAEAVLAILSYAPRDERDVLTRKFNEAFVAWSDSVEHRHFTLICRCRELLWHHENHHPDCPVVTLRRRQWVTAGPNTTEGGDRGDA